MDTCTETAFPLKLSRNSRYLVTQQNEPFLIVGDTPWSLIVDLSEADIKRYLDDRSQRGFSAIIVNLIEHKFATDPPRNKAGMEPFNKPGDFSTPNPAYFDWAHKVIELAKERRIVVWLCPAYLGWGGGDEGFFQEIRAGGPGKLRAYGRFVGARFKDSPNIVWMVGGDYAMPDEHRWAAVDLAVAIRDAGAKQLLTAHGGQQSAVDAVGEQPWLDINNTYSYERELFRPLRSEYTRAPVRPFVLIESTYEDEHDARPEQIRRQAYWAMLCGACGQFFGNSPIWHFTHPGIRGISHPSTTWQKALGGQGSQDMNRLRAAFAARDWHKLVPDLEQQVVTDGAGEGTATVTTAITPEGRLAMSYIPATGTETRKLTVNLGCMSGPTNACWYNPTNGCHTPCSDGSLPCLGKVTFTTPGDNGTSTNDWLLVLEAAGQ